MVSSSASERESGRRAIVFALGALYMAQGIPFGFASRTSTGKDTRSASGASVSCVRLYWVA